MDPINGHLTITLAGKTYRVHVPASFADREDVVASFAAAGKSVSKSRRAFAAAVALCVPEAAAMVRPHTLDGSDGDVMAFGRLAYDALRGRGIEPGDIATAATVCFTAVCGSLYPRAPEVAAAEDFTGAGEPPT